MTTSEPDPLRAAVDAATAFFGDIDAQRWAAAAHAVDPETALRCRDTALTVLLGWAAMQSVRPTPPDAPAAFEIRMTSGPAQLQRFGSTPLNGVRGVSTLAEFAALTPEQFVAASFEHQHGSAPDDTGSEAPAREILAAIADGAFAAQILYRTHRSSEMRSFARPVEQLSMRLRDGRWFVDIEHHEASLSIPRSHVRTPQRDGDAGRPARA